MTFLAALLYAFLMNVLPIADVIIRGRSPSVLLLLYWFETVLLLVTGAIRIVVHRRATAKAGHHLPLRALSDHTVGLHEARRMLGNEHRYLHDFVGTMSIFTLVHGIFVLAFVFLFRIAGPVSWEDVRLALFYVVFVQGLFLLWDLPRIPRWSFIQMSTAVGQVSLRVLVTQLGLIFGIAATGITGSAWGFVGTFVALRTFADAGLVWLQALVKRRDLPPGLARFLSRRSKQTVEVLEAEFDALKARGSEVEVLAELPIGEARDPADRATRAPARR